ncbi:MAG: NADH-quinone oxidoreductase subunit J [Thermodesulfobacteriota bacterium]
MNALFYISGGVAIIATVLLITGTNAVHALLYMITSLCAVAMVFFSLGAPFAAVLEVIVYAGAIMVLFVFVIMMLNLGPSAQQHERKWLRPGAWIGPCVLSGVLLSELVYALTLMERSTYQAVEVTPKQVSVSLFTEYMLGVELASILLLAGLVGAYHLGRRVDRELPR